MRLRSWGETSEASAGIISPVHEAKQEDHGAQQEPVNDVAHTWRPDTFMVIVAHPDDADFGPAGTAARWIDEGSTGWLVCCTSGDAGGEDPTADPLELAALREREQRAAAVIVGYAGVSFLHMPDGALVNDLALREQLVREIRTVRPDAVLTSDPSVIFHRDGGINHTDHRAAGLAAVDAVYPAARNPMAFPGLARAGLAAHSVKRLYLFWPNEPNVRVEIGATLERKVAALRAHASQIKEPAKLAERMAVWAAEEGEPIGVAAAEAFHLVVIDEDDAEGPDHDAGAATDTAAAEPATAPTT
jgi:LmbE family N-acetylglucosaminyl deacetylase